MKVARAATVSDDDRAALLDLWVAAWTEAAPDLGFAPRRPALAARLAEHLDAGAKLLTAQPDAGGPLVGYALVNPAACYVDQLAVDPAHQGRGIASALLDDAKRLCPEGLGLHVNQSNARAIRLYERHGFAVSGEGLNPRTGLPIFRLRWRPRGRPERGAGTMVQATWNDAVIARSDDTVVVEGNHYFPLDAVDKDALKPSAKTSVCPWKGTANYYTIAANGAENADAAWYYAEPKPAAAEIKGRVAFWKGVKVA